jgi:DNA-directed RNA polymerase specialized sigma24 family protein
MTTAIMYDWERPISETWEDVRPIMLSYAKKFQTQYGGRWDDWVSLGHEIYMKAYTRWKPTGGTKFTTWFAFFLSKLYMERVRRDAMQSARHKRVNADVDAFIKPSRSFDIEAFINDLSEDARMVTMMVLCNDERLGLRAKRSRTPEHERVLTELISVLHDIGWEETRIFDTFDEVSSALS